MTQLLHIVSDARPAADRGAVGGDTRPKLRPDCWYVPVDGGLHLRSWSSHVELHGSDLHPLLERLAPHLDGSTTLGGLVAGLPPEPARVVRQLVAALLDHGFAWDAAAQRRHGLAPWELRQYAAEIAYAGTLGGSGAYRFERFRLGKVLLVGAGEVLAELIGTLLRLGQRHLTVWTTTEAPTDRGRCDSWLARCQEQDPTLTLTVLDSAGSAPEPAAIAGLLAGFDAVLHGSDRPMLGRAVAISRAARAVGMPALHALPMAGEAWLGPADGGTGGGCFECALRRLRDAAGENGSGGVALVDQPDSVPALAGPTAAMVAAALATCYLRLAAGVRQPATSRMTRVDLTNATTGEHRLHPHPRCPACRPAPVPPVAELATLAAIPAAAVSRHGVELLDPRLGPVLELGEQDYPQLPVTVVAATVADPTARGGPVSVLAAGPDRLTARRRALVRALERRAGAGPDAAWREAVPGPGRIEYREIEYGEPMLAAGDPGEVAVAAGLSWEEALGRALLRLAPGPWPDRAGRWRPAGPDDCDEACQGLLAAAQAMATQLSVSLRAGSLTEVSVRQQGGPELARACAPAPLPALHAALETAVAAIAGRVIAGRSAADRPAGGHQLPPDLGAGDQWRGWLPGQLRRLAGAGRRVLVAPAGADPAVTAALPFLAAVTVRPAAGAPR